MNSGIYGIRNRTTGQVYIGSTADLASLDREARKREGDP